MYEYPSPTTLACVAGVKRGKGEKGKGKNGKGEGEKGKGNGRTRPLKVGHVVLKIARAFRRVQSENFQNHEYLLITSCKRRPCDFLFIVRSTKLRIVWGRTTCKLSLILIN